MLKDFYQWAIAREKYCGTLRTVIDKVIVINELKAHEGLSGARHTGY